MNVCQHYEHLLFDLNIGLSYFVVVVFFQRDEPKMSIGELKLTKPAPEWSATALVGGEFKEISLADYRGKYLVFFFYPADL